MKTTPIPVKFDRQDHSCNFYGGFGPTAYGKNIVVVVLLLVLILCLADIVAATPVQHIIGYCQCAMGSVVASLAWLSVAEHKLVQKNLVTLLDLCVSSLRRGHANLLCIVPILTDVPRKESEDFQFHRRRWPRVRSGGYPRTPWFRGADADSRSSPRAAGPWCRNKK